MVTDSLKIEGLSIFKLLFVSPKSIDPPAPSLIIVFPPTVVDPVETGTPLTNKCSLKSAYTAPPETICSAVALTVNFSLVPSFSFKAVAKKDPLVICS